MNSSKKILIILSLVFSLFYGINSLIDPVEVRAQATYNCPEELGPSATCDLPGGYIEGYYYIGWGDGCYYYAGRYSWSCSGTDTACTESRSRTYYMDENCTDDAHTGCCSTSGGGSSCTPDCGGQQCDWDVYNCDCGYYGCKVGDGDVADNPSCALCSEPSCTDPVCTPPSCPAPLVTNESSYYAGQTSCSNCKGTQTRSCYEVPSTPPTSSIQILPGGSTVLGCSSNTHTGTEVNNPINMIATFNDPNGASEIEAIYVWLKTDTATPNTPQYIDSAASPSTARTFTNNSWGFMMHKEGSSWVPYIVNRDTEWVKASYSNNRFAIKGPSSQNMVFVEINGVTTSGLNTINLNFDLDFNGIADSNKVADGNYNIFAMGNDVFGFTPYDNYTGGAQTMIQGRYSSGQIRFYDSWEDSNKNWYIDLTVPEAKINTVTAEYPTDIKFNSSISDAAGLYGFVSNLYVSPEVENQAPAIEIKVYRTPSLGSVTLGPNPFPLLKYTEELDDGSTIGNLNDGYLVKATNISTSLEEENITVDIDTNREDSMMYFVTAFDMACNAARASTAYDIEDWIVTYGGLVYSAEGIHFVAKNIDNESHWDAISLLNRLDPRYADVSSEMYANNSLEDYSFKREEEINQYEIGPFNAYRAIDFYKDIKTTFEKRELSLTGLSERIPTPPGSILTGNLGGGAIKVMDVQGDLTVGNGVNGFNCNGKGLFFIKENLIINGDITNGNLKSDACIFVVDGNVVINGGRNSGSAASLGYDQINAYILSNGDVTITSDSNFDGLYVNGGIQSLGDNGIFMDRYLGLNYRTTHPTFVVDHNSKYGILSTYLIGNPIDLVKVEVGFKPF